MPEHTEPTREMSTTEAARSIGKLTRSLHLGPVFLTSYGDVVAVVLNPQDYRQVQAVQRVLTEAREQPPGSRPLGEALRIELSGS